MCKLYRKTDIGLAIFYPAFIAVCNSTKKLKKVVKTEKLKVSSVKIHIVWESAVKVENVWEGVLQISKTSWIIGTFWFFVSIEKVDM